MKYKDVCDNMGRHGWNFFSHHHHQFLDKLLTDEGSTVFLLTLSYDAPETMDINVPRRLCSCYAWWDNKVSSLPCMHPSLSTRWITYADKELLKTKKSWFAKRKPPWMILFSGVENRIIIWKRNANQAVRRTCSLWPFPNFPVKIRNCKLPETCSLSFGLKLARWQSAFISSENFAASFWKQSSRFLMCP